MLVRGENTPMRLPIAIVFLTGTACATLMSYAAGKRHGAAMAQLPGCFEEEFKASETPPNSANIWWVACKDRVWKCRGRGLGVPPECHLDEETPADALP